MIPTDMRPPAERAHDAAEIIMRLRVALDLPRRNPPDYVMEQMTIQVSQDLERAAIGCRHLADRLRQVDG